MTYQVIDRRDQGKVRRRQEDNCYSAADTKNAFLILSDGMGGHAGGDLASIASVEAARRLLDAWPDVPALIDSSPAELLAESPSGNHASSQAEKSIQNEAEAAALSGDVTQIDQAPVPSPNQSQSAPKSQDLPDSSIHRSPAVTLAEWIRKPENGGPDGKAPDTDTATASDDLLQDIPQHDQVVNMMKALFTSAQEAVCNVTLEPNPVMGSAGCTLTVAFINGEWLHIGHVGDSRAYLYRQGQLEQLTLDHSGAMLLVASGLISPEAARYHPESHSLYRFLGGSATDLTIDVHHEKLQKGDIIMLCSDGLWGMLEDSIIAELFAEYCSSLPIASSANLRMLGNNLDTLATALINKANELGGEDNISVALAMV